jgi:hypothetical protein
MSRIKLLLTLLCLIGLTFLGAQTISKIELLHNIGVPQDYDYATTWSDSLLHFYRLDLGTSDYSLMHWTCNPSGVYTTPESIFSYTNNQPWSSTSINKGYFNKYGNVYLQFPLDGNFHFFCLHETAAVQHNMIVGSSFTQYYLFTQDYLYFSRYIALDVPGVISRYNLNTNITDSLFTWHELAYPVFQNIGDQYLLIYSNGMESQNIENARLIDSQLAVHECNLNIPPFMVDIYIDSPGITQSVYFASVTDGLLRSSAFGYVEINGYNINFYGISILDEMYPYPEAHVMGQIIPYANGRFSCLDDYVWSDSLTTFRNYHFNGTDFEEDFDFPDLHTLANPHRLMRMDSRYGLAICGINNCPRQFTLIDYQNQALTDTTFSMVLAPYLGSCSAYFSQNYLYYVYKTYQSRRLYIMKIVEYVDNSDPLQPPQVIFHSAYPNPFLENTTIKVSLKLPEILIVSIYNLKGQLLKTLSSNGKSALEHELVWDGKSENGITAAAGLYIYKASTRSGQSFSGKLMFLK